MFTFWCVHVDGKEFCNVFFLNPYHIEDTAENTLLGTISS